MGLNQNSQREGKTTGVFLGLLYAYEIIGESRNRLTHMRGEVWPPSPLVSAPGPVNPHARGSLDMDPADLDCEKG